MSKIFEHLDEDVEFNTENEYAKNYGIWRKKEELNKLKTKYGEDALNPKEDESSSSSSDDDEEGIEITKEVEKEFFKTLSCLKNKDPKIYDKDVVFFDDRPSESLKKKKKEKDQPMYLGDYERKIILEKNGVLSDEEDNDYEPPKSPTYVEEQQHLKKSLKNALENIDEENNEENWGGIFKVRQKTKVDKEKEELDYKAWLSGQSEKVDDESVKNDLKPLKEFWSNPNLDEGEKFLRDYILKRKFLDNEDENYIPTYDEIVHDSDEGLSHDEDAIEHQEEFEHKYNFRFEEPDQDFIKRYPRTIENSLRKTDDRRKLKRAEVKERKKMEKEEKIADLKKLQELKRKEIEEKIEKLKEITGNTDVGFRDEDLEGDFDPEAHDRRMHALFNEEFYQGPEDEQKPEFHDIDEELELENWEKWNGPDDNDFKNEATGNTGTHCEDENFNMDADYDPQVSTEQELIENSKGRKKRKRRSKFAEALSKPKPKYDPNDKNFEKYFEEYYKLDCEDIIGDVPCRFKYRDVVPNDFGLTIEEILLAKDRELNKWCSLKKAVQHRPDHVEKYEQIAYSRKGKNIDLKKKILPSLFNEDPETPSTNKETIEAPSTSKEKVEESIERKVTKNKEDAKKNNKKNKSNKNTAKKSQSLAINKEIECADNSKPEDIVKEIKIKTVNKKKKKKNRNKLAKEKNAMGENVKLVQNSTSKETTEEEIVEENIDRKVTKNQEDGNNANMNNKNKSNKNIAKKTQTLAVNKEMEHVDNSKPENVTREIKIKTVRRKKKLAKENKNFKNATGANVKQVQNSKKPSLPEGNVTNDNKSNTTDKKIKKIKKKQKVDNKNEPDKNSRKRKNSETIDSKIGGSKKKFKKSSNVTKDPKIDISDARLAAYGINPKKFKNKLKYGK